METIKIIASNAYGFYVVGIVLCFIGIIVETLSKCNIKVLGLTVKVVKTFGFELYKFVCLLYTTIFSVINSITLLQGEIDFIGSVLIATSVLFIIATVNAFKLLVKYKHKDS